MQNTEKQDIYSRITDQISSHLEKGVRPWVKPWNADMQQDGLRALCAAMGSPTSVKQSSQRFARGTQWITRNCSDGA